MSPPLSRYLKDFSAPRAMPPALVEQDFGSSFTFEPAPAVSSVNIVAERAEAFAEGKAAGETEARANFDIERAALEQQHAEALAALRRSLEGDALLRIENGYIQAAEQIAASVCDQLAGLLAPVMQDALAAKAVQKLATMIKTEMLNGPTGQLTVRGPSTLFEALKKALGEDGPEMRHVETTDLDISVTIDEAVLVTRLSAWAGSLKKVLG